MALIRIYKNEKYLTIPAGAYKHQYAPAGWHLEHDSHITKSMKSPQVHETEPVDENEEIEQEEMEESVDDVEAVESNDDVEDLEEKPLSELTVPELRVLAEHKGIDITGLTSAKRLREAIKSTM